MPPTQKAGQIDAILTQIMGMSRQEAFSRKICIDCKNPATEFRSAVGRREYTISCLCQKCQDKHFGRGEK